MVKYKGYDLVMNDLFHHYTTSCTKLGVALWPPENDTLKQDVEEGKPPHARKPVQFSREDFAYRSSFSAVNMLLKETKALTEKPLTQVEDYDKILETMKTTLQTLQTGLQTLRMNGSSRSEMIKEARGSETAIERIRSLVQDETVVGLYSKCFESCSDITTPLERLPEEFSRRLPPTYVVVNALDPVFTSIPKFFEAHSELVAHRRSMATTTSAIAGETRDDSQLTETPEEADGSEDGASPDGWYQRPGDGPIDELKGYWD